MRDWSEKGVCLGRIIIRRHTDKDCHCSRQHCCSRSRELHTGHSCNFRRRKSHSSPGRLYLGRGEWGCKDTGGRGIPIHFKHDWLTHQDKRLLVQGEHTSGEDLFEKGYAHFPSQTVSDELSAVLTKNARGAAPLHWEKSKAQRLHKHPLGEQVQQKRRYHWSVLRFKRLKEYKVTFGVCRSSGIESTSGCGSGMDTKSVTTTPNSGYADLPLCEAITPDTDSQCYWLCIQCHLSWHSTQPFLVDIRWPSHRLFCSRRRNNYSDGNEKHWFVLRLSWWSDCRCLCASLWKDISSGYDERCEAYSNIGRNAKRSYDIEGASGNVGMVLMERTSICSLKRTEWNIPSVKHCHYKQEPTKQCWTFRWTIKRRGVQRNALFQHSLLQIFHRCLAGCVQKSVVAWPVHIHFKISERLLKREHTAIVLVLELSQERIVWCLPCPTEGEFIQNDFCWHCCTNRLASPSKLPIISNEETTSFVLGKSCNESDIGGEVYFSLELTNPSSERLSSQSRCQQPQIRFGLSFLKHRFSKQRRCQNPIASVDTCATRQIWKHMKQSPAPKQLKTSLTTGTRKIVCPCLVRIARSRTHSRTVESVCNSGSFQASLRQSSPLRTRWNYRWASSWLFLREPVTHLAKHCLIHHCLLWTFYCTNSNKPEHRVRSWPHRFRMPSQEPWK